ncbi:MAG: hypothetical protein RIE58_08225, partial [Vicingaceae bacterium]
GGLAYTIHGMTGGKTTPGGLAAAVLGGAAIGAGAAGGFGGGGSGGSGGGGFSPKTASDFLSMANGIHKGVKDSQDNSKPLGDPIDLGSDDLLNKTKRKFETIYKEGLRPKQKEIFEEGTHIEHNHIENLWYSSLYNIQTKEYSSGRGGIKLRVMMFDLDRVAHHFRIGDGGGVYNYSIQLRDVKKSVLSEIQFTNGKDFKSYRKFIFGR